MHACTQLVTLFFCAILHTIGHTVFLCYLRTLAGCMCGSLQLHQQQRIYINIKQIVMTTSPVTSNPNTDLISEIGKSLKLVDHLIKCPKLIICDGYKIREKNKFRSGEITQERVEAYAQYKLNLHALTKDKESVFSGAQVSVYIKYVCKIVFLVFM
jgi:hypothetical protein